MDGRQDIEAGLKYAREALAARMSDTRRDPDCDASLALALLALLKAREDRRDETAERDEPVIINFERAKRSLASRRVYCASSPAPTRPVLANRAGLKIYRGE